MTYDIVRFARFQKTRVLESGVSPERVLTALYHAAKNDPVGGVQVEYVAIERGRVELVTRARANASNR